MTAEDYSGRVDELFERQLRDWDTVRDNYAALDGACLRTLELDDALIVLQHNPERRRSAAARLDDTSQPCFLCRDGQPAEQEAIVWADRYKIQVNPYPIFPCSPWRAPCRNMWCSTMVPTAAPARHTTSISRPE